jgi:phosphohistidine phosphatase
MRTLYLLRHGKAESGAPGGSDHARALAPRGRRDAETMGGHLASQADPPVYFLCSSAVRAIQTLDRVRERLSIGDSGEVFDDLYLATPERMLERVMEVDDAYSALLMVGHNPGIAQLAEILARSPAAEMNGPLVPSFPTAAIAALRFDVDAWFDLAPGRGAFEFTSPKLLGATR